MQLFVSDFELKVDKIIISNLEIINQIRKVLRMKIWDKFSIQNSIPPISRYQVKIIDLKDKTLQAQITDQKLLDYSDFHHRISTMIISMPNKREKAELIVQKLTEIWIQNIIFRPSQRSIIKVRSQQKADRIQKITKEALEQSRWYSIPKISYSENFPKLDWDLVIFDKNADPISSGKLTLAENIYWLIWPEWWLWEQDYEKFKSLKYKIVELGSSVLRMETAAIVWWRLLKNQK